jgi:hypothetical protein
MAKPGSRILSTLFGIYAKRTFPPHPSPQVPNNASGVVDHHFLGFGIETASFPDYTGIHVFETVTYLSLLTVLGNKSHPNNFSLNMFSNNSK